MGPSDHHEAETRVHGLVVPAIATAQGETGEGRGTGGEAIVSVASRKVPKRFVVRVLERSALHTFRSGIPDWPTENLA
jgi:hypothetical protein